MLYKTVDVPYVGSILISTIICSNCGFKITDIWMIFEQGNYEKYQKLRINKDTINYLIVASSGSKIIIPEIDAELDIKTFNAQHITTIEGLLREIHSAVKMMIPTAQDKEKALSIAQLLEAELADPSGQLTIIIIDPCKHSAFIPYEHWVNRTERERELPQELLEKIGKDIIEKWKKQLRDSDS